METIIFLHIPKTAGTTFGKIIKYNYGLGSIYNRYFKKNRFTYINLPDVEFTRNGSISNDIEFLKTIPSNQLQKTKIIRGHMHFGIDEYLPQKSTYITLLRDPIQRVISLYNFIIDREDHLHHKSLTENDMSLKEFVESKITTEIDNAQTRLFAGNYSHVKYGCCTREMLEKAKDNLLNRFAVVLCHPALIFFYCQ